jgi:excisionase family DNA binding protein
MTDEVTLADPAYWLKHRAELLEGLKLAARPGLIDQAAEAAGSGVGVVGTPGPERLTVTVEEAAQVLGISRALAYEAVRRGEIPHIRIGKRILVPRTALDRLLQAAGG